MLQRIASAAALLALSLGAPAPAAAIFAPITAITASGTSGSDTILLESVTAGGQTLDVSDLATGTSSGVYSGGNAGVPAFPVENADDFNITSFASRFDPHDVVFFGGELYAGSGAAFDFVIFENGGNDGGTIQPIFADDSLGQAVTFDNTASFWGGSGFTSNVGDQPIAGMTFSLTDLLDALGDPLAPGTSIKGIRISSGGLDPSTVAAVVPEPGALALLAAAGLSLALRRRALR